MCTHTHPEVEYVFEYMHRCNLHRSAGSSSKNRPSAHLDLILGTGERPAADDLRGVAAGP